MILAVLQNKPINLQFLEAAANYRSVRPSNSDVPYPIP